MAQYPMHDVPLLPLGEGSNVAPGAAAAKKYTASYPTGGYSSSSQAPSALPDPSYHAPPSPVQSVFPTQYPSAIGGDGGGYSPVNTSSPAPPAAPVYPQAAPSLPPSKYNSAVVMDHFVQQGATPAASYPAAVSAASPTNASTAPGPRLAAVSSYSKASGVATAAAAAAPGGGGDEQHSAEYYTSVEYLKSALHYSDEDIQMARSEHVDDRPDMCGISNEEMRDYAGVAIVCYFRFVKFLMFITVLLFILSLSNFLTFIFETKPEFKAQNNTMGLERPWFANFFISGYRKGEAPGYIATTAIALVFLAIAPLLYRWSIGRFTFSDSKVSLAEIEAAMSALEMEQQHMGRNQVRFSQRQFMPASAPPVATSGGGGQKSDIVDDALVDVILRYTKRGDIDVSAHYRTAKALAARRLFSVLVLGVFICVSWFSSVAITKSSDGVSSFGASLGISVIAATLNITFVLISRRLTQAEMWTRLGHFDISLVIKLVAFKVTNIFAVYGSKSYSSRECVYDTVGVQMLTLLLTEIFFSTPLSAILALLLTKNHQLYARVTGTILGDDMSKARFELPIEYLSVLYKFLIGILAMLTVPLSTVLTFLALLVEFHCAKWRLISCVGNPMRSGANHRNVAAALLFLIFLCSLFTPYAGFVFIASGRAAKDTSTTTLCGGFPNDPVSSSTGGGGVPPAPGATPAPTLPPMTPPPF